MKLNLLSYIHVGLLKVNDILWRLGEIGSLLYNLGLGTMVKSCILVDVVDVKQFQFPNARMLDHPLTDIYLVYLFYLYLLYQPVCNFQTRICYHEAKTIDDIPD